MLHPVIRLLLLAVLAAGLAPAAPPDLLLVAAVLSASYLLLGFHRWGPMLRMLARLRVFYLSIAVVYLWFTPGEALLPALEPWSPTLEGLILGLRRVAALVLLVAAVQLLLETTAREELVAGVVWWARPLVLLGLDPNRLALRMVLALETVPRLRETIARRSAPAAGGRLRRLAGYAADAFAGVLEEAEQVACPVVEVPLLGRPALLQWLLPLLLAAALWYL